MKKHLSFGVRHQKEVFVKMTKEVFIICIRDKDAVYKKYDASLSFPDSYNAHLKAVGLKLPEFIIFKDIIEEKE